MRRKNPNFECHRLREISKHLGKITKAGTQLACYFCFEEFEKEKVSEWVEDGEALCPSCEMNSVVPVGELSEECTLQKLKDYWFEGGIQLVVEEGIIKDVINVKEVYLDEDFQQERKALIGLKINEISS